MREIKDYLHLYLGCECEVLVLYHNVAKKKLRALLLGVNRLSVNTSYTTRPFDIFGKPWDQFYETTDAPMPILRKLSSMTEEEAIELYNHLFPDVDRKDSFKARIILDQIKAPGIYHEGYCSVHDYTDWFTRLLSKHFDLFGLIDEGLAIDKDTLK